MKTLDSELVNNIYFELTCPIPTLLGYIGRLQANDYLVPGELSRFSDEHNGYDREHVVTFLWLILVVEGYEK